MVVLHAGGDATLAGGFTYLVAPTITSLDVTSGPESGGTAELSEVGFVKYDVLGLNNLPVIADGNIVLDGATATTHGAVYSKEAFIYVVSYEPENWVVYDDSLRGWEIGIVHDYAMVEEDGQYGRYMYFDTPTPTS